MTVEHPLGVAYRAIREKLIASSEVWGDRVSPESAASTDTRPYVVMWSMSGDIRDVTRKQLARLVIGVKVVADDMEQSMNAAARIAELLDSQALNGGNDWNIVMSSQGAPLHMIERLRNAQPIYHDGFQFRVWLERKA
jgi:hypothetical protein